MRALPAEPKHNQTGGINDLNPVSDRYTGCGFYAALGAAGDRCAYRGVFAIPQEGWAFRWARFSGERATNDAISGDPDGSCHHYLLASPAAERSRMGEKDILLITRYV